MPENTKQRIIQFVSTIYDAETCEQVCASIFERLEKFSPPSQTNATPGLFHQTDIFLITYGDMLQDQQHTPLQNLRSFYKNQIHDFINTIHILPFFPYSSDDGFSIIDYKSVNPKMGDWDDIADLLQAGSRLMFDAVINHISAESEWFQKFLAGDEKYKNYFITVPPETDLSMVTRPRSLPLLTVFKTAESAEHVWTTFSSDQIDLNFANPDTLLDIIDVILFYIEQGSSVIRLDAIAYLWKEFGTTCIHLPQTHAFVKLLRAVLDSITPEVLLITETNVPHEENISYFGDGADEAHMVYQFSLPPLTAHALITGSAKYLSSWAAELEFPSHETTFFNFTASHDGVGVRPATGILPEEDISILLNRTIAHGGRISSKANPDGSTSPYELNINYFDLLNSPVSDEAKEIQVDRFIASQAIMLMLKGIPGIYFHSLVGSRNDYKGVEKTGHARSINREKLEMKPLLEDISTPHTLRNMVFNQYKDLIAIRIKEKAFHPAGDQKILNLGEQVFTVLRTAPDGTEKILALQNVSSDEVNLTVPLEKLGADNPNTNWLDLIAQNTYTPQDQVLTVLLAPYQTIWLKPE